MNTTTIATFGELMMRLDCPTDQRFQSTQQFRKFFGGAEANVAVVLSQLGIRARFVSALPQNDLGQSAVDALRSFGVDTSFIHRTEGRIGLYFTEHGNAIRPSRVIYDRKHSCFSNLGKGAIAWDKALEDVDILYWSGISAALTANATDACREAIRAAVQKNIRVAVDMNYRSTLWDYGSHPSEIMPELLSQCEIVTGDLTSIEIYLGITAPRDPSYQKQFETIASELKRKLPAMKVLAMSFRGTDAYQRSTYHGALLAGDTHYFSEIYSIPQVVDRIGSGDAMQAGLLYGLSQRMPAEEVINFAIACGAIKHSMEGDFTLVARHEVDEFIKTGPVSRVIR